MKPLALIFLIAGLFLSGVPLNVEAARDADLRQAVKLVDDLASAEFAKNSLGSITVGVVHGRKLIWTKSYGYADIEKKELATRDTVYRIGGTTAKFTALMLLQLVEAGKIEISDPVEKYFPEINTIQRREPGPPVTFLQLATHTSGINNEPDDAATYTRGPVGSWEQTLIAALPHTQFIATPGVRFLYSNMGYAVLGAALSRVAGESYVSYVEKRIFAPLGMKHTSFEPNAFTKPRLAKGYIVTGESVDGTIPERDHQGRGYKVPSGAVYSTVGDLARFISFELGEGPDTVLKKQTLEENYQRLIKLETTESLTWPAYGVGFQVMNCSGIRFFGYGGFVPGYHARGDFDRAANVGFIVLRNIEGGKLHESTRRLSCDSLSQLAGSRHNAKR
jgi:CubicO group peptidase (beta-lactamase class C family)